MPHKSRDKSTSFQHFPRGHFLLRISLVVSWVLEQMEWTLYSVQPLEQKSPPPSKPLYCIRFCTSGKKAKLLSISCLLIVLVTSHEGHFTLADAVLGGLCSGTPLQSGKCPKCMKVAQIWLFWPDLHSDPKTESCDLSLHFSTSNLGETETCWALCWPELLLFYIRHVGGTE